MARFGRNHTRSFILATLAALVVVGVRLALPWTLKAALHPWLGHGTSRHATLAATQSSNFATIMAGVFLLLMIVLGLFDLLQRLNYARFAIGTIRDLRAAAFTAAISRNTEAGQFRTGDLIARLVGDTTRIKAGMKGFFVHVTTNGMLYLGATAMLLWMNPALGAVFALAGLVLVYITWRRAVRMYDQAARYRSKEGKLADSIQRAWNEDPAEGMFSKINQVSGRQEAALTRIQGVATLRAHTVFGVAVVGAFLLGLSSVAGGLDRGDMVVFILYALTLRVPVVQLVRQGTRTGKILACVHRLDQILKHSGEHTNAQASFGPLRDRISLAGVVVRTGKSRGRRRMLGPIDLEIPAGQHVAIVGRAGAGKTTLLRVIAGIERARKGHMLWDGAEVTPGPALAATPGVIGYAAQHPGWRRAPVRTLLGLGPGQPSDEQSSVLSSCRADRIIKRLPGGLDERVGPRDMSPGEGRAIAMSRVMLTNASVLLLDDPVCSLSTSSASRAMAELLARTRGRTLVVSFVRGVALEGFDRVIELKKGKVAFDGPPVIWAGSAGDQDDAELAPRERIGRSEVQP